MGKTADLKKLIKEQLDTLQGVTYYRRAPETATFPYKVFSLQKVDTRTDARDDIDLCVDIWDKGTSPARVELIGDQVERLLDNVNLPQETILPTIYRESRYTVDDADPNIQRVQLHFYINFYENE